MKRLLSRYIRPGRLFVPLALFAATLCGGGCTTAGSASGVHPEAGPGHSPEPTAGLAQQPGEDSSMAMALGPGDVFEVKVFQDKDLSSSYLVGPEGTIHFPLIGSLVVQGLTPNQLAEVIRQRLQDGFIREPVVSVFLKEANSKKIFVFGQVSKPGSFTFVDKMNIIQAITLAGGFTGIAARDGTNVTRREGRVERKYTIPISKILDGARSNFLLKPGDIVFVPESMF